MANAPTKVGRSIHQEAFGPFGQHRNERDRRRRRGRSAPPRPFPHRHELPPQTSPHRQEPPTNEHGTTRVAKLRLKICVHRPNKI